MAKTSAVFPLLAYLLWSTLPLSADDYPRQPGIDVQHYVFRVALRDTSDEIQGRTTVTVRFTRDEICKVALDLASPQGGKGMTVASVTSAGAAVPFAHRAGRLLLTLPAPAKAGDRASFTIEYSGVPAGGLRIGPNQYGERSFFSANWPNLARQWLPTVDHPYDKATNEFLVTAPSRYQVVANGALQETTDLGGNMRLTHWKESVPIATWLANIGVARFSVRRFGWVAGVPLESWVFPADRQTGIASFEEATRRAAGFFSDLIGPYPYEKLAGVEAPGFKGGMEHASAIFFGEENVANILPPALVAHEIAHQWFGNSVTEEDWDEVWLSEGFATYLTMLFTGHWQGRDAFLNALRRSRDVIFETERKSPEASVIRRQAWEGIPNPVVYQKGAWTLHMLSSLLGERKFRAGLREYYRRHRDANASTSDFRQAMEDASGADLGWFFQQWLYRPGSPSLEGTWSYDAQAGNLAIELKQMQPGEIYRLPLEVGIAMRPGEPPRIVALEVKARRERFEIPAEVAPASVALDPNARLLAKTRLLPAVKPLTPPSMQP